jgi:transcriptional regulator with XRE-family HTH domain
MSVGENIRAIREKHGLGQSELAEKANLSAGFLSEIETGKKKPSLDKLEEIASVLGCPPSSLLENADTLIDDPDPAVRLIKRNDFIRQLVLMMEDIPPGDLADVARVTADKKELAELRKLKGA